MFDFRNMLRLQKQRSINNGAGDELSEISLDTPERLMGELYDQVIEYIGTINMSNMNIENSEMKNLRCGAVLLRPVFRNLIQDNLQDSTGKLFNDNKLVIDSMISKLKNHNYLSFCRNEQDFNYNSLFPITYILKLYNDSLFTGKFNDLIDSLRIQ